MGTVGKGEATATVVAQSFAEYAPTKLRLLGRLGHLLQRHLSFCCLRPKQTVGILHLLYRCLNQLCRYVLGVFDHGQTGALYRNAPHLRGSRTPGTATEGHHVGIALNDVDVFEIDTQCLAENLCVSRAMPLAVGEGANDDINSTVFGDTDHRLFLRPTTAGFHIKTNPSAPQQAVVCTSLLALGKA